MSEETEEKRRPVRAVQQIMLGRVLGSEKQAAETLRLIRRAGYDGIELNGFMIRKTPPVVGLLTALAGMPVGRSGSLDWQSLIRKSGLAAAALHEDLGTVERDLPGILREAQTFGTDTIVITGMYRYDYTDPAAVSALADRLNKAGRKLAAHGLSLLYHNHNCEFRRLPAQQPESGSTPPWQRKTAYDLLLEQTDPEAVGFEFDSYWAAEAGVDVLSVMRKLGTRMKLYHINDRGTRAAGKSATPILKSDSMELGFGSMNLPAYVRQALANGVSAVILESHRNWAGNSPVQSLQMSAAFMREFVK